jgi:hypothetical protein
MNIPIIERITSFSIREEKRGVRNIEPASATAIANHLPNIQRVKWSLDDDEKWTRSIDARRRRPQGERDLIIL